MFNYYKSKGIKECKSQEKACNPVSILLFVNHQNNKNGGSQDDAIENI